MDYVIARTHVIDHERFLEAGSAARDLWLWGMLYAGKHETDGEIPMSAVMASPWGAGGKANVKLAMKLVEVGLWARTEKGFLVLKWTEMGNKTKDQIEEARKKWRKKKKHQRDESKELSPPECPQGTPEGTPRGVLNSPSYSPSSGSSSGSDPDLPDRSPMPRVFGRGATAEKALEVFADAVTAVTGESFVIGPAMFLRDDVCQLLNVRAPAGGLEAKLEWLGQTTEAWVRATPDSHEDRKPMKLNDWLNKGRPSGRSTPKSGGGPRGDRQPHDQAWLDRMLATGTDGKEF